ncbi:hypothetical protein M501DRAFT_209190 [Patellaria atrata CBS 101060]|uniref:Uncharacterized protein n=1 Tax=Patellaria atrata CBS 101060 TaxID=1346257 RepID=A0A9P4VPP1_9PEZI|nr:hypothetical protein M501DRAFT_209190 [Patellaria atrata CBS 101060]
MPIRNLLNVGQMNPITHKIKFSKDLICTQQKFRDWHHKKQVLKSESYMVPEDFLAFITLCSVYAKLGPHIQHANGVKETLQILPRNDFTSLFNYVNGHVVMQNFESPWSSSVAEVVKMNIDGNAFENQTLKWKDQSRNEKESDKEREFWHETPEQARSSELNVKRWLDEIPKRDWLTRMDSRVKWGDGSIGRLGGRFEWVAGRNDTKEYAFRSQSYLFGHPKKGEPVTTFKRERPVRENNGRRNKNMEGESMTRAKRAICP